jgi:serine/threonine-protein kinase
MRALVLTLSAGLLLACTESSSDPASFDAGAGDAVARATDARVLDAEATDAPAADALAPGADAAPSAVDAGPGPPDATAAGPYFERGGFFTDDVSGAPVSPSSAATIAALRRGGGWGNRDTFQIDFSLEVLHDDGTAPLRMFTPTGDFYEPDCDLAEIPVPVGGNLEGEDGYACTTDGDCHLLVYSPTRQRLFEMWRANIDGASFAGGCLAVWDTSRRYGPEGRGLQCTSADAAGFPIAPLLFDADEVAAREIRHAIRFILPNDRVRRGFVPPATHGTNTTGGPDAPYYGAHLRLRADYPLDRLPNEGARTVARALQRYGMYHADGGQIALTARSDRRTRAKWEGLLGPRDLSALRVEDFELIDHGASVPVTFDCVR